MGRAGIEPATLRLEARDGTALAGNAAAVFIAGARLQATPAVQQRLPPWPLVRQKVPGRLRIRSSGGDYLPRTCETPSPSLSGQFALSGLPRPTPASPSRSGGWRRLACCRSRGHSTRSSYSSSLCLSDSSTEGRSPTHGRGQLTRASPRLLDREHEALGLDGDDQREAEQDCPELVPTAGEVTAPPRHAEALAALRSLVNR
jgi:hypothetical protein